MYQLCVPRNCNIRISHIIYRDLKHASWFRITLVNTAPRAAKRSSLMLKPSSWANSICNTHKSDHFWDQRRTVVTGLDSGRESGRSVEPDGRWRVVPAFRCYVARGAEESRLDYTRSAPSQSSLLQASLQLRSSSPWPRVSGLFRLGEGSAASLIFSLGTGWRLFDF